MDLAPGRRWPLRLVVARPVLHIDVPLVFGERDTLHFGKVSGAA